MSKKKYSIDIDGYIGYWTSGKRYIKQVISDAGEGELLVRVNSLGGNLDDGIDIAAQFEAHSNVTCEIFALNASSATVLTLGAKKVRAHINASYLIHKALFWVGEWGYMNEDNLDDMIERLKQERNNAATQTLIIARMYARKSSKPVKDILFLMKEEKWLTATEAKEWGFVDEVFTENDALPAPVDDSAVDILINAAGLPPVPRRKTADNNDVDNRNILTSIMEGITSLKSSFITNNKNTSQMKKDYLFVNATLSVEGIDIKDGKALLTEEQLELLNKALDQAGKDKTQTEATIAEKDKEITGKDKEIADLKTQVSNLSEGAGDDTKPVAKKTDDTVNEDPDGEPADYVAAARKLFNALPD